MSAQRPSVVGKVILKSGTKHLDFIKLEDKVKNQSHFFCNRLMLRKTLLLVF